LPKFQAVDSEGNQVISDQLSGRVAVVVFFDPDSVLAWRTLSELGKKQRSQTNPGTFILGFASQRTTSDVPPDINSTKKEFQIPFPVVRDQDKHFSEAFQSPSCCDYLNVYDKQGTLKTSMKLSESYEKLDSLLSDAPAVSPAVEHPFALTAEEVVTRIKISDQSGNNVPLPTAPRGLTILNLFSDFCSECLTGNRLQTMGRLNQFHRPSSKTFIVFSKKTFSNKDIQNFKAMLPLSDSLVQGDIEVAEPFLIKGKLLIVLDANKRLIWQERAGMTEDQVLADVSHLLQSSAN
jgi:peroxiredoxin